MSIAAQITRIQAARNTIRAKLVELGLATNTDNLDVMAESMDDIVNQGSISAKVKEGETYTIPKGYHSGSGTVSGVSGGGNYALQSKPPVTPTKKQQQITPDDGFYGLSDVTVGAIPDNYQDVTSVTAGAGDVLSGKTIVDKNGNVIVGNMANNPSSTKTLNISEPTCNIPKGYHDGTGKINIVLEEKTVTPTENEQSVTPTDGKVLSKVKVDPIPNNYKDTTPVTATANKVLVGHTFVDGTGVVEGTMADNGLIAGLIDGLTSTEYTIPKGYVEGGRISLTSDIEDALAAI